jgi:YHS domain-containing protein
VIKCISALFLAFTLGAVALAQSKQPTSLHCAVMKSSKVNITKATKAKMYTDYKGRRYFFCCPGCPEAFKKNPAKFSKSESVPTPKPAKK